MRKENMYETGEVRQAEEEIYKLNVNRNAYGEPHQDDINGSWQHHPFPYEKYATGRTLNEKLCLKKKFQKDFFFFAYWIYLLRTEIILINAFG